MKKNWISIFSIVIAIVLAICSWFLLPEIVAVQVGADGQVSNTMPKWLAIILPFGISVVGSVMNLNDKTEKNIKGFILAFVGIGIMIWSLFFNRC